MIRGMHYMCWFPEDWNYHPSMPMKRLQQVQDIVDFGGNTLLWSCLGSAAIGLPYLDREANETIPPRLRFYGYLNDSEFCQECAQHDITAYAVVWKAQMWEFPAEFSEDESQLLALNKLKGVGKPGWIGMRELSTDRYPKLFEPIRKYFPNGLKNSDGELITDFLDEFKVVTLDGSDLESAWLLVPGHDHHCYTPCGSNPAFAEYQRKEVEMMIDANAGGIMVDEIDMHLYALNNAGCFCKDCMKGFRVYLKAHPSAETQGLDLDTFDYRAFLKAKGYRDHDLLSTQLDRYGIPLYRQFVEFNLQQMETSLADTLAHAKAYSRKTRGQEIPVAANLFNCLPHTSVLRKYCDLVIGERSGIGLRQDGFYRFGYAFFAGKNGSFIEDPSDHILTIVDDLKHGKTDTYVLFMLEPLSQGFNIAIPYGAWLINWVKDSFYPDMETERQLGDWLKVHESLFVSNPMAEIAVLYDARSALEIEMFQGGHLERRDTAGFRVFHDLTQSLCDNHVLYNILYVSDDQPLTADRLQGYTKLLLPDAFSLRDDEMDVIDAWIASGGKALALGRSHSRMSALRNPFVKPAAFLSWVKQGGQPVDILDGIHNRHIGLGLHKMDQGYGLHLVNYWFDDVSRTIGTIPKVEFKLSWTPSKIAVHSFPASNAEAELDGQILRLKNLGLYTIVEMT